MGAVTGLIKLIDIDRGVRRLARVGRRPWWASVLIGLACAAAMLLLRKLLSGFYGEVTGFMILLPAVIAAALAGGRIAGLTALFACLFGGWAVVGFGTVGAGVANRLGVVATTNFIVVGLFATVVAASLRKTLSRLDATVEDLRASAARISETEGRLHLISELAPVMLWMSDEQGACVHLNEALRRNDPEKIDRVLHTIKGAASNVGLNDLAVKANALRSQTPAPADIEMLSEEILALKFKLVA